MLRSILGFVAGYVVMAMLVMAGFVAGPLVLGVERVFRAGTYDATLLWQMLAILIGLVAAFAGAFTCCRIAQRARPAYVLLVVTLAVAMGTSLMQPPRAAPAEGRPPGQSLAEVMEGARLHASEPPLTRIANPLAAAAGICLGIAVGRAARRLPAPG